MAQAGTVVGFIGLGAMGQPMAANLLAKGFAVQGFDLSAAALETLRAAGGVAVASPAEAARDAAVLVLMVATPAQAEACLFGADNALDALPPGATVVLNSTVSPAFMVELGKRLAERQHPFIDAPVSGGQVGAIAGTLTIMASGSPAAFAAAGRVLDAMAGKVYRLGDEPGIGSTVKMINQHLCGVHIAAAAEAMALGAKAGADPRTLYEVIMAAAGMSWMFGNRVPHMLDDDFTPKSAVEIFVKDLGIVLDTGRAMRFPLPVAAAAHQQFLAAAAMGHGRLDDAAVVKVYESLTGARVASAKPEG